MGTVKVTNIEPIADNGTVTLGSSGDTINFGSGVTTGTGIGKILQVVQAYKTDTTSISNTSGFTDVTGLSVNITPSSTSNKILIMVRINAGGGNDITHGHFRIERGGTSIGEADAAGNRTTGVGTIVNTLGLGQTLACSIDYIDSPASSSQLTYNISVRTGSNPIYINRSSRDNNGSAYDGRGTSSITVMEIAA